MIDLKKLKLCPTCNLKLYSLYIHITLEYRSKDDIKRKFQFIGKICKNRHHFIDESNIHFNNYSFKIPIDKRVFYIKLYETKKQFFKRLGFIWIYDDFLHFDDLFYRYNKNLKPVNIKNQPLEIFFHYPIEKREKIKPLKIFDIKYGIEKRMLK